MSATTAVSSRPAAPLFQSPLDVVNVHGRDDGAGRRVYAGSIPHSAYEAAPSIVDFHQVDGEGCPPPMLIEGATLLH